MSTLRVLSVRQPWAWLIALGEKRIENRTWSTPYRGPVAIHATRCSRADYVRWLDDYTELVEILSDEGTPLPAYTDLPMGAVVAVCQLTDCSTDLDPEEEPWWHPECVGWVLDDIVRLRKPIAHKGGLGLRQVSPDLAAAIQAEL